MSQFCDTCPMKGTTTGPVEGIVSLEYVFDASGGIDSKNEQGLVGALYDGASGMSELIHISSPSLSDMVLESRIDMCQRPLLEQTAFTRRFKAIACPALGAMKVRHPGLAQLAQQPLRLGVSARNG